MMPRRRQRGPRSTPAGEHRPVLLDEVLAALGVQEGDSAVDATLGYGGHAAELLRHVGPTGLLIGMDLDAANLPPGREKLAAIGHPFHLHHGNFAGIQQAVAAAGVPAVNAVLAD